jgi:ribonucrease Y
MVPVVPDAPREPRDLHQAPERLEEICTTYPGVEKVYAMHAGREVRVMVKPDDIDDLSAQVMARDLAKQSRKSCTTRGRSITSCARPVSVEYAK